MEKGYSLAVDKSFNLDLSPMPWRGSKTPTRRIGSAGCALLRVNASSPSRRRHWYTLHFSPFSWADSTGLFP